MARAKNPNAVYEQKVEQIYYRIANGVQIDIFNLGKISKAGVDAYLAGGDDAAAENAVIAAVAQYREN